MSVRIERSGGGRPLLMPAPPPLEALRGTLLYGPNILLLPLDDGSPCRDMWAMVTGWLRGVTDGGGYDELNTSSLPCDDTEGGFLLPGHWSFLKNVYY